MELSQRKDRATTLAAIAVAPEVKIKQDSRLGDLVFGSISGFTGKLVEYPFDTIKVHLQTQPNQSLWTCIRSIVKTEGFAGFYTGISAPLLGSMAENAVLFLAYAQIQQLIRFSTGTKESDPLSTAQLCCAGGLSGAVVSYVLTPVELLKCRLQMQDYLPELASSGKRHHGALSLFKHIVRSEGISGLYKGHTGTVLREVAGGAAWFGVYEVSVKKMIEMSPKAKKKQDLAAWQLMGAGALAGMSYNAALYPSDVIKSRIQSGLHNNESFCTVVRSIYKQQGIRGFFRGFGITVARSAPSSGVIFLTYELLSRKLG